MKRIYQSGIQSFSITKFNHSSKLVYSTILPDNNKWNGYSKRKSKAVQ